MNKTALMIIDVQMAMFLCDGGVYKAEETLNNIHALLTKARVAGIPVIFIQHTSDDDDEFSKGKETWNIHPKIAPVEGETVVYKSRCDSFYKTNLQSVLEEKGIKKLVIAGMQTEFCVDTTCRSAFSRGYESILAKDSHSTFDSRILKAEDIINHHNNIWGGSFAELKNSSEIEF